MTIDRRVARTRSSLYDALFALIRERDYEAIGLGEILRRANVGRSTFYAHFRSKDELLARSVGRLRDELIAASDECAVARITAVCRALFRHVDRHRDIYIALASGRGGDIVHRALAENIMLVMRTVLPASERSRLPRELAIAHVGSTFRCVLHWWLDRNPSTSWQEADAMFQDLLLNGLGAQWPQLAFR